MALNYSTGRSPHEAGFLRETARQSRLLDLMLLAVVPAILVAVFLVPAGTRETLVFEVGSPTLLTAYTSHFVHLSSVHLVGNLVIYLPVVGVAYLLCLLSGRRQLFVITFLTLLLAFPFALSAMQLAFPQDRAILGFSGINAGFVGLACFALVSYVRVNLAGVDERYAPALLFFTAGLIALVALPSRGYRIEIGMAAIGLGLLYVGVAIYRHGFPTRATIVSAVDTPGYFEFAGVGVGLLVGYPFVAFQDAVVPGEGVVDVYVHLLGYSLAFIVVFSFVFLTDEL